MKRLSIFILAVFAGFLLACKQDTPLGGDQDGTGPEDQGSAVPGAVAVSLTEDLGKDGLFIHLLNDGTRAASPSPDGAVFFFIQEENRRVLYYNPSAEGALSDPLGEGVLSRQFEQEGLCVILIQGNYLVFRKVDDGLYNVGIVGADGTRSFLYGIQLVEDTPGPAPASVRTRMSVEDVFHLSSSALLKLASFTITALETAFTGNPLGFVSTALTETMKSDFFGMRTTIGEKNIKRMERLAEVALIYQNLAKYHKHAALLTALASELNDLADNELAKVGEIKEDVVPDLGEEWVIRVRPPWLLCPNNDTQYVVPVRSKAQWTVDDANVDKTWCSVTQSGDNLVVTIRKQPAAGTRICHATIRQAMESTTYRIAPVDFRIELHDAEFSLYPRELVFGKEGGSKAVAVEKSDHIAGWHIDHKPDWCTITTGDNSFFVDVGASDTGHKSEPIVVYGAISEETFFRVELPVRQEAYSESEAFIRNKLVRFYYDTGGPTNWYQNDNWCSDRPLEEWFGVYRTENGWALRLGINGLTGHGDLSGMTDLEELDLVWGVKSLDISGCTGLKQLSLGERIEHVDATGCTSLSVFPMTGNYYPVSEFRTLNFSGCTALERLECHGADLESINVSGCTALKVLDCSQTGEKFRSVDVSECVALESMICQYSSLESLDVTGCHALKFLDCSDSQLTSMNVSGCGSLEQIDCSGNLLESLDVSSCADLKELDCSRNHIIQKITTEDRAVFYHDRRYDYWYEYDADKNEYLTLYKTNPYGWYYEGEPFKGYHGR